jgi:hypothetical protein
VLRIRIRDPVLFPPGSGIRDGAMVGSGIRDKQSKFVNSLYTKIGRIRDPGSGAFYPPDPGSGIRIRDGAMVGSGIRDKTSRIRNTACYVMILKVIPYILCTVNNL